MRVKSISPHGLLAAKLAVANVMEQAYVGHMNSFLGRSWPGMLTTSSSREDCAGEVVSIWRDRPQPRITQADVADVAAKRRIVFKHRDDAVRIRAGEEVPRCNEPCHLGLQIRLGRVEQLRDRKSVV